MGADNDLVTLAELGQLSGVSRQAVWNWSRRKDNFPEPISEGPNGPVYRLGDFRKWLKNEGQTIRAVMANASPADLFESAEKGLFEHINHMNSRQKKAMRLEIADNISSLQALAVELDPIKQPDHIFDPSNPNYMGRFTASAMLVQSRHPLGEVEKFYGSGVYAIYYTGKFAAYSELSGSETPIYCGKADPSVAHASDPSEQGLALSRRINEHKKSITAVSDEGGLRVEDFEVRYLVTSSGFQTTAETFLINYFRPIWNKETKICFGIGKHGDDATTRSNKKSPWDTIHPGRKWAYGNEEDRTSVQIANDIAVHLRSHPPIREVNFRQLFLGD